MHLKMYLLEDNRYILGQQIVMNDQTTERINVPSAFIKGTSVFNSYHSLL